MSSQQKMEKSDVFSELAYHRSVYYCKLFLQTMHDISHKCYRIMITLFAKTRYLSFHDFHSNKEYYNIADNLCVGWPRSTPK